MKAAIALLSNRHVQNIARKIVFEIHKLGNVDFMASLLPAHVSLKQPFTFENMDVLEAWFEEFSGKVPPLHIELDHVYYDQWDEYAIIGLSVCESPILRALHNQINHELKTLVKDPSAPHDGEGYRFHLTAELGKVKNTNPFKQFYESLPEKHVGLTFLANSIALFFYADGAIGPGSFMCYKVLPLTGES